MLAIIVGMILAASSHAQWVEGLVMGVPADSPAQPGTVVVFTTGVPWNAWQSVALTQVPTDTVAVYLHGLGIITHGTAPDTCDLNIEFRAPGTPERTYTCQTVEAHVGGGQRSGCSLWVPTRLVAGKPTFEYRQKKTGAEGWPTYCAFLWNFKLNGYLRGVP